MRQLESVLSERHTQFVWMARIQKCNGAGRSIALHKLAQVALMPREKDAFRVALGEHRQPHSWIKLPVVDLLLAEVAEFVQDFIYKAQIVGVNHSIAPTWPRRGVAAPSIRSWLISSSGDSLTLMAKGLI